MCEWATIRLRDLCESVDYGLTASSSSEPIGPKFLRITDIVNGYPRWSSVPFVDASPGQINRYRLEHGDIVIARTGATTGRSRWICQPPDAIFASYLIRLKVRQEVDSRFLGYLLQSNQFLDFVNGVVGGTSAQPNASATTLTSAPLRIPAKKDSQEAIAEVLGAFDDKIAVNDRIRSTAFNIATAMFRATVKSAGKEVRLGDIIELKYGRSLPARNRIDGPARIFGSGGVCGLHNEALVEGPGVIVGRKGTVGSVYWSEHDFFPIDTTFYVTRRIESIPLEFIFFLLRSLSLGSRNSDSAVPGLNRANALEIPVCVPHDNDLRAFGAQVGPIFELYERVSCESSALAALRDALLPKLMSGEIRVRGAEKAVEDAL